MCHYCGCREIPLIKDFIAEHEAVTDLGGSAVRALDRNDVAAARSMLLAMAAELRSHWVGEETGLFAVMRQDPEYRDYIDALIREHRELAAFLGRVDLAAPAGQREFRQAVEELHHHIAKEEDGLFPASLTALSGADWDLAMAAWRSAHPG